MSKAHLVDLRNHLARHHWRIARELPGDGYRISAVWEIVRPSGVPSLHLEFEGLNEAAVLPLDQAYACHVKEAPDVSAYFARVNRSWPDELNAFLGKLNGLAT
jgi:hypothetical protein